MIQLAVGRKKVTLGSKSGLPDCACNFANPEAEESAGFMEPRPPGASNPRVRNVPGEFDRSYAVR